jgi:hypothetical protein
MGLKIKNPLTSLIPLVLLVSNLTLPLGPHFVNIDHQSPISSNFSTFNEDTIYEGDLILDGNTSILIENCSFKVKGRIRITDNSTLILRNAKIRLIESNEALRNECAYWFSINGNARFQANNITIETVFFQSFGIHVSDRAEASFNDVYSLEWYSLVCEGGSRVSIVDSVCWSMIETRGTSVLTVRNSRIYGVNVTGESEGFLEGVYTTRTTAAESGSLEIYNSTISSETEGLELIFDRNTELTLKNFHTTSSGISYELCEHWSLYGDNKVSKAYLNVTLHRVFLKLVQFVITDECDVDIDGLSNLHANIVCSDDNLEVVGSSLNQVEILKECTMYAHSVEFVKFQATRQTSAYIDDSKLGQVSCSNESIATITSSEIGFVDSQDAAILKLNNSSLPGSIAISENAIILHTTEPFTIEEIEYRLTESVLNLKLPSQSENETQLDILMNRDRIRNRKHLEVLLDGEAQTFSIDDEMDLRTISFQIPPGEGFLSISLGPVPPERVPFLLTPVGQQLISFSIILVLIVAVLVAWR